MLNRIPPLLVFVLVAAAMFAGSRWLGPVGFTAPGRAWIAALPAAAGVALAVAGVAQFRRAATTVDPRYPERASALVRDGVYRFTRNPMYLGLVLVLAGWAAWLGGVAAWLGPAVLAFWLDRVQIPVEERAMRSRFGKSFADYCRRTRRWL